MRESRTSRVGPLLGSCRRWNSSLTTIPTLSINSERVRSNESSFSLVQTRISESSIIPVSPPLSPIARPTRSPTAPAISLSSFTFSVASAFNGTMYNARAPSKSVVSLCTIVRCATSDLPLAVGIVSITLRPDKAGGKASA